MKKLFAIGLAVCISLFAMTACSSKDKETSSDSSPVSVYDVNEIAQAVEGVVVVDDSMDIGEDYLTWLGIPTDNVTAFAGKYCRSGDADSFNIVLVVEAADGTVDDVKSAIEAKKDAISAESDLYSKETVERLDSSIVYSKGNYIVWATSGVTDDMSAAYSNIQKAIENRFSK